MTNSKSNKTKYKDQTKTIIKLHLQKKGHTMQNSAVYLLFAFWLYAVISYGKHKMSLQDCYAAPDADACEIENGVFRQVNELRAKAKVPPLKWSMEMGFVAREWSDYMTAFGSRSHRGFPHLRQAILNANFPGNELKLKGENVAEIGHCPGRKSTCIMQSWIDRPGYTATMLNPEYTHMGVGISNWSGLYATALFAY
jgi:uncharacterized protein YkwD